MPSRTFSLRGRLAKPISPFLNTSPTPVQEERRCALFKNRECIKYGSLEAFVSLCVCLFYYKVTWQTNASSIREMDFKGKECG